ncbi:uncharacterized protein LOC141623875 [Silene latifolia]|uniref:uncharacterized protein LOC141623875 n=1 Tax=Silene latifolia TaxID=37657 RepID=UPI003D788724
MVKPHDDSISNNLEIVSIGTLYSGQWDKKYWSSSRGKDRYPYPIGYQALRTHNGLTYKMEVYEGTKGPIFQITSNDKKSGVGETPDRAWENFQKKGCSRVKLLPGKRFSGKFDGVEFFGFKNALVQRLLRELLASVNDASNQSSQFTNASKASADGQDVGHPLKDQSPELMSSLDKTKLTGKRRRTCRGADTKSACKKSQKICQPLSEADIGKDLCNTRMTNNCEPVISSTGLCEIDQADGPLLLLSDMELRKNVPLSGHSLPIKYIEVLDDSKAKSSIVDGQSDLASRGKGSCISLPHENKSFDRQCTRVQEHELSAVTEVEYGNARIVPDGLDSRPPVLTSIQISRSAYICAQDTSETRQGIGNVTSRTELVADMVISEEPITGSHSEAINCYFTGSSEKSDFDTAGEDIANSMLSVLLPRAIPFLTYSSRKKRRKASSSKELSCGRKSDNTLVGTLPIIDDISPARAHAKSDVEGVKRTDPISGYANPFESEMENVKDIVPDSLDDDQSDYLVGNKLPLSYKNAKEVLNDLQEKSEPFGKSSSDSHKATELFYNKNTNNKTRGRRETFNHEELPKNCNTSVQNDGVPESHFTVGCQTYIPTNRFLEGKDHWSTAVANSKFIEHSCKKTEGDTIPDGKDMFSQDSAGFVPKNSSLGKIVPKKAEYSAPLSESIIFRNNGDNCAPEKDHEAETLVSSDFCQLHGISNNDQSRTSLDVQGKLERQISHPKDENAQEALGQNSTHSILQAQEHALNCAFTMDGVIDGFGVHVRNSQHNHRKNKTGALHCKSVYQTSDPRGGGSQYCTSHIKEDIAYTGVNCPAKQRRSEIEDNIKLIGCYSHLMQISSVKLAHIGHEIYICVSCGPAEDGKRDLFLYKLSSKEPSQGRPDMVGHTSIRLPLLKDEFGREVAMDKSGLQFTPDASGLVLIDSIRMPYCRENNLNCSCPQCESCCFEENAVKIVQIQQGYASVILKLNTIYAVHCILVCEPQCLIAVDESGRIYIWIMDPTWSLRMKQHIILSNDFLPSRIVELKRVPKSSSMVIGHNGYGQFSLWDIAKRTVVSQFSAPANSVLEYLPVSLFRWQSKSVSSDKIFMEERVKKLVEETTLWFSGHNEVNISCLTDEKDIALWVLMYTSSNSSVPSASSSSNYCSYSDGCWRLCLLVKSTVIMGAAFPSSTAIGTSSGIGIIGTYEGHVDIWELPTGNQLGSLHHRAGKRVSHVAVDDSFSSIIAIAHDDGQLCVYLRH